MGCLNETALVHRSGLYARTTMHCPHRRGSAVDEIAAVATASASRLARLLRNDGVGEMRRGGREGEG
jgi:hypothetical protein